MAKKVIKDATGIIPMHVSGDSFIKINSSCDTRDSFLNAKLDEEIKRATSKENSLQDQIDNLREAGFAVRDVVAKRRDLNTYDTSCLIPKDIVVVLDDNDCSSFYRWDGYEFTSIGSSSYTVDKIDSLIQDLQGQIEYLGMRASIRDVVTSHQDLENYDLSGFVNGDILVVLVDEVLNNATTYYKYNEEYEAMEVCGSMGPNYYNKVEIDSKLEVIYNTLEDHEVRITDNRNELDDRISEEDAYDVLIGA